MNTALCPYKLQDLVHLKMYTVDAANIIQSALHMMDDMKFGGYVSKVPFLAANGTFGLEHSTAYVIVLSDGELALETFDATIKAYKNPRARITYAEAIEVVKNCVKAWMSINAAFLADPNNSAFASVKRNDDKVNPGEVRRENLEKIVHDAAIIVKYLDGEELTEDEKKVIGRPLNPFEQSKLIELQDLLWAEMSQHRKCTARSKIRQYLQKIKW